MSALPEQPLTPDAYLNIEHLAETKCEFLVGRVSAMSGSTYRQSRLKARPTSIGHAVAIDEMDTDIDPSTA